MSDRELIDAVALNTGEDSPLIQRHNFVLTGPEDADLEPECLHRRDAGRPPAGGLCQRPTSVLSAAPEEQAPAGNNTRNSRGPCGWLGYGK
jgi:hypothetical protein